MFNRALIMKLLSVALVAAVMLPAGSLLFPYVSGGLSSFQFHAIEAVVGTTVGFGIVTLFG